MALVRPLDLDGVRGAVDVLDLLLAFDGDADVDLLRRPRTCTSPCSGGRGNRSARPACGRAASSGARRCGWPPAAPERRSCGTCPCPSIPAAPGRGSCRTISSYIRRASLASSSLAGYFLAVDHQRHLLDRPVVGQRKDERHFHRPAARVDERLRHLHLGHLVDQPGLDAQLLDLVADLRRRRHGPGGTDADSGGQMMIGRGSRTAVGWFSIINNPCAPATAGPRHNSSAARRMNGRNMGWSP